MGLPLYVAPTEAQRRHKGGHRQSAAHANGSILRTYRHAPNTLRESRRRRVLATVAARNLSQVDRQREQEQEREQERHRTHGSVGLPDWPPAATGEQILQRFLERARQPELPHVTSSHGGSSSEVPARWRSSSLAYPPPEDAPRATEPGSNAAQSPPPPPPRHSNNRTTAADGYSPGNPWGQSTLTMFGQVPTSPSNLLYDIYHNSGANADDGNNSSSRSLGLDGQVDHAFDDFLGEGAGDSSGNTDPLGRRQAFSSRLIRHASSVRRSLESAPLRRSVVGWSDHDPIGRLRRASPSRHSARANSSSGGGDTHNNEGHQDNSGSAAANRRRAWAIRYYEPNLLPSIRTILSNPVDGLGDRSRSLSPEGDGVWETLSTTMTPDPQPPSVGSSFASTTAPAPTAGVSSASPTGGPTAAPLAEAVSTRVSPPTDSFASDEMSASASASSSQRARSLFTIVSASTDTADESTILPETTVPGGDLVFPPDAGQEPGCEDSEMDGDDQYMDMARNHRTLFYEPQPWETRAYASFASGRDTGNSSRSRSHSRSHNRSRGHGLGNGINNGSNSGDDLLERLGISGMLSIVRNLARREDIPDELWAEAGLSRTLGRGASN